MDAYTVRGWGALFVCVDLSVDLETGCCTVSVCVDASAVVNTGWAVSSVCVHVPTTRDIRFCGGDGWEVLLGGGRPKG